TDGVGMHTIEDIVKELRKPGLDPRSEAQQFEFAPIYSIEEVHAGMEVPGVVTNLTRFGAFVDIGVKQDGLVHVSEIAHKYISDPNEVLKLNQKVQVKVLEVDIARKRIVLSIKQTQPAPARPEGRHNNARPQKNRNDHPKQQSAKEKPMDMNDALHLLKNRFGK
ncbi:MAG: S1 RNA-binding domain-containing protein, partial [Chitinophagia bacterium]|nr:S1 RNA-binding domain-containing protein [Chitinophagia bacterium]